MLTVKQMPKAFLVALLGLAIMGTGVAVAQDSKGLSEKEIAKITSEAQATLNATRWEVEVVSKGADKEARKTDQDVVLFKDGKLHSEGLAKKGYGTSNYTLTVGDDGVPVFETMQRNAEDGVVFWRGELVEGKIRGVISVQIPKQPSESFGFRGAQAGEVSEIPAETVEPQPEPVPETVEPVVAEVIATESVEAVTEETAEVVADETLPAVEAVAEEVAVVEEKKEEAKPQWGWWQPKKQQ